MWEWSVKLHENTPYHNSINNKTHTRTSWDKYNHWLISIESDNAERTVTCASKWNGYVAGVLVLSIWILLYNGSNFCARLPDRMNAMPNIDGRYLLSDTRVLFIKYALVTWRIFKCDLNTVTYHRRDHWCWNIYRKKTECLYYYSQPVNTREKDYKIYSTYSACMTDFWNSRGSKVFVVCYKAVGVTQPIIQSRQRI